MFHLRAGLPDVAYRSQETAITDKLSTIFDAIAERMSLHFHFDGKERCMEPHVIGVNQDGELVLRAAEEADGGHVWHDVPVSGMSRLTKTTDCFHEGRPGYDPMAGDLLWIVAHL